ncbi:hypothetical protein OV203_13425 [Nannocystis sp. ILAH1]|uniref:hypothetical protein n=1 Tax=unclassified Nannocystis TaxID=2627009 RepID=UPI00226FB1F1|nr:MULTISPECIES: hypothetical protein [unclassified Nannocystis]MCY0988133.1 hypothetical protein [Nannocystis sp. ILAH1]MCY1065485.1 hypothetical protein [Nannocystis sp. RBIL2]
MRHLLAFAPLLACVPDLDVDLARVDAPRVLAVRAEPAEVVPGEPVALSALYVDAGGTLVDGPLEWAFCAARRPLAELGPVSRACLGRDGGALLSLGTGLAVDAPAPADGCRLFGPEPPPATADQPAGRPVDPDITGGYYQPLRIFAGEDDTDLTLFQLRITCGLAGADQQQSAEYRTRARPNRAPAVVALERDGDTIAPGVAATVAPGGELPLRLVWETCPEEPSCGDALCTLDEAADTCPGDCGGPIGCGGAETYLRFDPTALELVTEREAIRVAWYATGGRYTAARTGRAPDEREAFSDNTWTAPDAPGDYTLWIVVRDDRGGADWRELPIRVE